MRGVSRGLRTKRRSLSERGDCGKAFILGIGICWQARLGALETMHLRSELERRAQPSAAYGLDLVIALGIGNEPPICLALGNDGVRFDPPAGKPDATFHFDGAETAAAILYGEGDFLTAFMDAFMAGRVRSDGNLPLTFTLLALFRPGLELQAPD